MFKNRRYLIMKLLSVHILAVSFAFLPHSVFAEETKMEKAETKINQAADSGKKALRDAQDKTCEMIDGKLKCTEKKLINKLKNTEDKLNTKTKEFENKVD